MTLAELLGRVSLRARHGWAVGTLGSQGSNLSPLSSLGGDLRSNPDQTLAQILATVQLRD
jgi:hypothetical protein